MASVPALSFRAQPVPSLVTPRRAPRGNFPPVRMQTINPAHIKLNGAGSPAPANAAVRASPLTRPVISVPPEA